MSDETINPPSVSTSGRNAYYIQACKVVEHNAPYASCLDKMRQIETGAKLPGTFPECVTAIRRGTCVAVGMRKEELLKGVAIYYKRRERLTEEARESGQRWNAPLHKTAQPAPKPTPAVSKDFLVDAGTYADALNASLKAPVSAPKQIPIARPPMNPGESPMQYAIRCRATV